MSILNTSGYPIRVLQDIKDIMEGKRVEDAMETLLNVLGGCSECRISSKCLWYQNYAKILAEYFKSKGEETSGW
jgi:L-fucose isomerase-like protein